VRYYEPNRILDRDETKYPGGGISGLSSIQMLDNKRQTGVQQQPPEKEEPQVIGHYQKLLEQSALEKTQFLEILKEKDQMMQKILKDREDYKDKYIQNLESQLKNKDDMMLQMLSTLT